MKIRSILTENSRGQVYQIERIVDADNNIGYRYYYLDADNQFTAIPDDHPYYKINRTIRNKLVVIGKEKFSPIGSGSGSDKIKANAAILNINGKNANDGTAEYDLKSNGWTVKDFVPGEEASAGKPITGLNLRAIWNQLGVGIGGTTKSLDAKAKNTFGKGGKLDRYMTGKTGGFGQSTRADSNNSMFKKLFVSGGMNVADKLGMFGNANPTKQLTLNTTVRDLLDKQVNLGLGPILFDYIKKFIKIAQTGEAKFGPSMGSIDNPNRPNKNPQESVDVTEAPEDILPEPRINSPMPPGMPGEEPEPEDKVGDELETEKQKAAVDAMQKMNQLIDQGLKSGLKGVRGTSARDSFILLQDILSQGQLYPAYRYLAKAVPEYNQKAVATAKLSMKDYFADKEIRDEFLQKLSPEEFDDYKKLTKSQADKKYGEKLGDITSFQKWKEMVGVTLPRDRNFRYYNPDFDGAEPGDRALRPNKAQQQANDQDADSFKGNLNNKVEYGKALKISRKEHPDLPFPPFAEWLQKVAKEIAVGSVVKFTSNHATSKGKKIDAKVIGPAPAFGKGFIMVKSLKTADNPNPGPNEYVLGRHRIES